MMRIVLASLVPLLLAAGCSEEETATRPFPVALTDAAAGHYCQMTVIDHPGPKAQVHLAGNPHPLFFTQVRDALAYGRMPEQEADIVAIYVNDMGAAGATWDDPGTENWIPVDDAVFVHGSGRHGGMGAPEFVPFSDPEAALRFIADHGGATIAHAAITDDMVLAPVDVELGPTGPGAGDPDWHSQGAS